jgi:hypothetical protein
MFSGYYQLIVISHLTIYVHYIYYSSICYEKQLSILYAATLLLDVVKYIKIGQRIIKTLKGHMILPLKHKLSYALCCVFCLYKS